MFNVKETAHKAQQSKGRGKKSRSTHRRSVITNSETTEAQKIERVRL